jgi:hypothetical protein
MQFTFDSREDVVTTTEDEAALLAVDGDVYHAEVVDLLWSEGRVLISDMERKHVNLCCLMGLPAAECIAHLERADEFLRDALEDAGYSPRAEGRQ